MNVVGSQAQQGRHAYVPVTTRKQTHGLHPLPPQLRDGGLAYDDGDSLVGSVSLFPYSHAVLHTSYLPLSGYSGPRR